MSDCARIVAALLLFLRIKQKVMKIITRAARVTPIPIPAFAPPDNVPGGSVATSVKFPGFRIPVADAEAEAQRPSFETTVQTAPLEQHPPSLSSQENWPWEQFGSWIVATVVGGATKELHAFFIQLCPFGQQPPPRGWGH